MPYLTFPVSDEMDRTGIGTVTKHLACSILTYSSQFIVTTNHLRLSVNAGVKAQCHIWRSPQLERFFSCKLFLQNHFDWIQTYVRAFHIRVRVAVYMCVWCISLSPTSGSVLESPSRLDEEHRLIARYAARLAAEAGNSTVSVPQDAPWWASVDLHFTINALTSYC